MANLNIVIFLNHLQYLFKPQFSNIINIVNLKYFYLEVNEKCLYKVVN